jgi:hypothetical protein
MAVLRLTIPMSSCVRSSQRDCWAEWFFQLSEIEELTLLAGKSTGAAAKKEASPTRCPFWYEWFRSYRDYNDKCDTLRRKRLLKHDLTALRDSDRCTGKVHTCESGSPVVVRTTCFFRGRRRWRLRRHANANSTVLDFAGWDGCRARRMNRGFILPRSLITSWTYTEGRGASTCVERDQQVLIT